MQQPVKMLKVPTLYEYVVKSPRKIFEIYPLHINFILALVNEARR